MIANRSALNPFVDHKHHVPYAKFDLYESYGMSNEIPSYVSHAITSLNSSKRHMPIKILLMEALAKGTMSKKRILKKTFTYSVLSLFFVLTVMMLVYNAQICAQYIILIVKHDG